LILFFPTTKKLGFDKKHLQTKLHYAAALGLTIEQNVLNRVHSTMLTVVTNYNF